MWLLQKSSWQLHEATKPNFPAPIDIGPLLRGCSSSSFLCVLTRLWVPQDSSAGPVLWLGISTRCSTYSARQSVSVAAERLAPRLQTAEPLRRQQHGCNEGLQQTRFSGNGINFDTRTHTGAHAHTHTHTHTLAHAHAPTHARTTITFCTCVLALRLVSRSVCNMISPPRVIMAMLWLGFTTASSSWGSLMLIEREYVFHRVLCFLSPSHVS